MFSSNTINFEVSMGFSIKYLLVTDGLSNTRCEIMKPQYTEDPIRTFHFIKYSSAKFSLGIQRLLCHTVVVLNHII